MGSSGPLPDPRSISSGKNQNTLKRRLARDSTLKPPTMPKALPTEAAKFWRKHAKFLHEAGKLTGADVAAFERLCLCWHQLVLLDAIIEKDGLIISSPTGVSKQHPGCAVRASAEKTFASLVTMFGLSPMSRLRVPDCEAKQPERMRRDRSIESKYLNMGDDEE